MHHHWNKSENRYPKRNVCITIFSLIINIFILCDMHDRNFLRFSSA